MFVIEVIILGDDAGHLMSSQLSVWERQEVRKLPIGGQPSPDTWSTSCNDGMNVKECKMFTRPEEDSNTAGDKAGAISEHARTLLEYALSCFRWTERRGLSRV